VFIHVWQSLLTSDAYLPFFKQAALRQSVDEALQMLVHMREKVWLSFAIHSHSSKQMIEPSASIYKVLFEIFGRAGDVSGISISCLSLRFTVIKALSRC
jgi:hypothetical protein